MRTCGLPALLLPCLLASACGEGIAPEISLTDRCRDDASGLEVQIEAGHPLGCGDLLPITLAYRTTFEARFGQQHLEGRVIRYRNLDFLDEERHTGHTYANAIDLARFDWADLPHELNHVRVGRGHDGWCLDFEPWSESVLGIDERAYLGCP